MSSGRWPGAGRWRLGAVLALAATLLAACSSSQPGSAAGRAQVVTWAEAAGSPPNYIFPLASSSYFSVANTTEFSYNMYLPLYWFGNRQGQPAFNPQLSIGEPPQFSDGNRRVTITLKHWSWSDGQPITARDVIFWLNLLSAATDPNSPPVGSSSAPGPGWGGAVPGGFPTNVTSYSQTGTYSLTLTLNTGYNPTWFLYNELSQIFPLPVQSWDRLSSSGPVGDYDLSAEARVALPDTSPPQYVPQNPGTASSGALGVAEFLNLQSQDLGSYATSPLWKVVDGPFVLSTFTTSGYARLVPNRAYSGSPKPSISALVEEPFTSDTAEFDALKAGTVTVGYVPVQDLSARKALEASGHYRFSPWNQFGIIYAPYNFTNPTVGPIFRQLYFRQAIQSLVDQPLYIRQFQGGIGQVGNGPVPSYPPDNPYLSPLVRSGSVYPYDPQRAVTLLSQHGWKVEPGGTTYCAHPGSGSGECGAGVRPGQQASFSMLYASGYVELANEMAALQSTLESKAGIHLLLRQTSQAQVFATAENGCSPSNPCSNWDLADWGVGWVYSPDSLPTGGEVFSTGAASNGGDYSDPTNDSNIAATHTAPNQSAEYRALFRYEDYLATQLPVIWLPSFPFQLTMYKSNLRGLIPQGVYDEMYPQYYSLAG
ncbi:MAG: ABC transporter substrate-binding protein [Candidatus Dormibacteria bacterium]